MKWQPYPECKESNLTLLGRIPDQWSIIKCKYLMREVKEHSNDGSETLLSVSEYYGVAPTSEVIEEGDFLTHANSLEGYKKCATNDLVINIMLAWKHGLGISPVDGIVSPSYSVFRCINTNSYPRYLHYLLRTDLYVTHFKSRSTGIINSRLRMYPEDFGQVEILLPSLSEQERIASFLDRETERIDNLIAKKQRQIELLQEKRSALISHVVTKGLNPEAKMKDSGVEWLGEIPEHWVVVRLREVLNQRVEHNIGPKTTNILSVIKDVGVINYDDREASGNKKSDDVEQYKIIHKGDIVLNRMNVIIGSVGISPEDGAASIEYYVLYERDDSVFTPYYGHIFCSRAFQTNLGRLGSGILGHRQRIPYEILRMEELPKPPYEEQLKIAHFLDNERNTDDGLIQKLKNSIELLQEYRTVLISAAVTGKIDVRQEVA